jgi:hypothetical protein
VPSERLTAPHRPQLVGELCALHVFVSPGDAPRKTGSVAPVGFLGALADRDPAAGLDEGLLSFSLPHSRLYR